jgi:hypothetical protein
MLVLLAICICLLLLYWYARGRAESFAADRSGAIVDWFAKHGYKPYEHYKSYFGNSSSIVDYEAALRLGKAGRLNTAALAAILRDTRRTPYYSW